MPNTTETEMSAGEPGAAAAENMSSAASVSSVASVESSAGSEQSSTRSMPPPSKLPGLVKASSGLKPPGASSGIKPPGASSGIRPPGASSGIRPPGSLSASGSVGGSNTSLASISSMSSQRTGRTGRLCDGHPKKDPTPSPGTPNASAVLTEDTDSFIIGERVYVGGTKPGRLAYIGDTQFAPGEWAGVVLDDAIGKNDGSVGGVRYFQCEPKKGVFSRLTRLTRYPLPESALASLSTSSLLTSPTTPVTRKAAPRLGATPAPASKAASPTPTLSPSNSVRSLASGAELKLGERVIVMSSQTGSKAGVLRYKGPTAFAAGEWCGVELDDPMGKNDGSVAGTRYFDCQPKFGLFAPAHKVSRSPAPKRLSTANCKVHHANKGSGLHGSRESLASSIVSARSSIGGKTSTPGLRTTPTSTSLRSGLQDNYFNNYNNYNKYTYTYNYDINWEDCY